MPSRRPLSVSSQVVLALLLGVVVGLFFGEHIAPLQSVGKAFILLLQMTVLPYIVLSLMTGLGNLTYQQVKTLALRVGTLLLISWGLAFVVILLMPLAFPTWISASFFSTSLIENQKRSISSPSSFRPTLFTRCPTILSRRWSSSVWRWG